MMLKQNVVSACRVVRELGIFELTLVSDFCRGPGTKRRSMVTGWLSPRVRQAVDLTGAPVADKWSEVLALVKTISE